MVISLTVHFEFINVAATQDIAELQRLTAALRLVWVMCNNGAPHGVEQLGDLVAAGHRLQQKVFIFRHDAARLP